MILITFFCVLSSGNIILHIYIYYMQYNFYNVFCRYQKNIEEFKTKNHAFLYKRVLMDKVESPHILNKNTNIKTISRSPFVYL